MTPKKKWNSCLSRWAAGEFGLNEQFQVAISDLEQRRKYTWKTVNPVFKTWELLLKSDFEFQDGKGIL